MIVNEILKVTPWKIQGVTLCKVLIIRWLAAMAKPGFRAATAKSKEAGERPTERTEARPKASGPARALPVLLGLFGDEGVEHAGLEVVDLHGALHLGKSLGCNLAGGF